MYRLPVWLKSTRRLPEQFPRTGGAQILVMRAARYIMQ